MSADMRRHRVTDSVRTENGEATAGRPHARLAKTTNLVVTGPRIVRDIHDDPRQPGPIAPDFRNARQSGRVAGLSRGG